MVRPSQRSADHLRFLADPNIPLVEEAFQHFGKVRLLPGRDWTSQRVTEADVLLVRSVTPIDAGLLDGSNVRFVGSATSGVDHVDLDYLRAKQITFANAAGSNATSVAEYVLSALLAATEQSPRGWGELKVGIIGYGHVGTRVARLLKALNISCIINDPPLKEQTHAAELRELDEALSADVITLHVPLTHDGTHPTYHLLNAQRLARIKPGALIINAARGGVIDEHALIQRLCNDPSTQAIIDCWQGEPAIDMELLRHSVFGTPHIAGYAFDGKLRATQMLSQAFCDWLNTESCWQPTPAQLPTPSPTLNLKTTPDAAAIRKAVYRCYDIRHDDAIMRGLLALPAQARSAAFDALRKDYRIRREFAAQCVALPAANEGFEPKLTALGFNTTRQTSEA